MDADQELLLAVAGLPTVSIDGQYFRHVSRRQMGRALDGSRAGGRWGPARLFPVVYLTDDYRACVVEAYRHRIDPVMDRPSDDGVGVAESALIVVRARVERVLNLMTATARVTLGLEPAIYASEPQTSSGMAYRECNRIAVAAHRLDRHGVLVPSATQLGATLAVFADKLEGDESLEVEGQPTIWTALPPDPRRLRLIRESSGPA